MWRINKKNLSRTLITAKRSSGTPASDYIHKIESIDTYKPIPVVNIPPLRFIGGPKNQ